MSRCMGVFQPVMLGSFRGEFLEIVGHPAASSSYALFSNN